MYRIVKKETLTPNIVFMRFEAPRIANSARPGQFLIVRTDEMAERIPMMIADWNREEGTVDIVFFVLGTSTSKLAAKLEGECVSNIAGPLGTPLEIENFGTVICACGCFGIGPTLALAKALKAAGNEIITVIEGRGPEYIYWVDRLKDYSDQVHVVSGCGNRGWANDFIEDLLASGKKVDRVFVHGCPFMMKVTSDATTAGESQDHGELDTHHGGRHGHVRSLPGGGGWKDQVRLRGGPGLRCPPGELGCHGAAVEAVPAGGGFLLQYLGKG